MLELLETGLVRYGTQNLRYDGKMRSEMREAALVAFRKTGGLSDLNQHQVRRRRVEPHIRQSRHQVRWRPPSPFRLNRNFSNHNHHSMDLSWSFAADSQAYDRVHRLGEENDVSVKHLVVENTIEEHMPLQDVETGTHLPHFLTFLISYIDKLMDWCDRLVGLADAALGEGTGVKLHKLSVKEIKAVRRVPIPLSCTSPVLVLRTLTLNTALRHALLESVSSRPAR